MILPKRSQSVLVMRQQKQIQGDYSKLDIFNQEKSELKI